MQEDVPVNLITDALKVANYNKVLPFRFIAAAKNCAALEPYLEEPMLRCMKEMPKLERSTVLLVDVSGSMMYKISSKSDLQRIDAACGLAILARGICDDIRVFKFNQDVREVPARSGFALRDAIGVANGNTDLRLAIEYVTTLNPYRVIVITDEQSATSLQVKENNIKFYIINVSCEQHGVMTDKTGKYGTWVRINGWSEAVFNYIQRLESFKDAA